MFGGLLSKGGLSLDRLAGFCEVAAVGGVTRAAKGDPVRQSLLSRQIKDLEEFFGVELVRRKGRGIELTDAGSELHRIAREQLTALADFQTTQAGRPVTLTIAAGESLLRWLLLPRMPELQRDLSGVRFRFLNLPTAEVITRLRDGSVDLGLVRDGGDIGPLKTRRLGGLEFSWFVPRSLLAGAGAGAGGRSLKALLALPLAVIEGAGQHRATLERLAANAGRPLNIRIELPSLPLVAEVVRAGLAAAVLPAIARGELVSEGIVELRPRETGTLKRRICLVWNRRMARVRPGLIAVADAVAGCVESGLSDQMAAG